MATSRVAVAIHLYVKAVEYNVGGLLVSLVSLLFLTTQLCMSPSLMKGQKRWCTTYFKKVHATHGARSKP